MRSLFRLKRKQADTNIGASEETGDISSTVHHDEEMRYGPEKVAAKLSNGDLEGRDLKRDLNVRHLCFLAIGTGIGTGLFIGSGNILAIGGPGSLLINFVLVGFMVITVLFSVGEIFAVYPFIGSYANIMARFVDSSFAFCISVLYCITWILILPLELTTATIVITFWDKDEVVPQGVWIAVILVFVFAINLLGVRMYGEFEFFATTIKIVACIGFIICAAVIDCGGAPSGKYLGASTWYNPGAFNNSFKGFCSAFAFAALSYGGTEIVGITAAEAKYPHKMLPKAVKFVVYRVLILYIATLFTITLIVPYNASELLGSSSDPRASPFVITIQTGAIYALPAIFNGVILISVISVASSAVYSGSRLVHSMAQTGFLPVWFAYSVKGAPVVGYIVAFLFGMLAFLVYSTSKNEAFAWLGSIAGISVIFLWLGISISHLRFRLAWRKQGYTNRDLPWASPLGIYGTIFGTVINILVLAASFYSAAFPVGEGEMTSRERAKTFFQTYLPGAIFVVVFVGHKICTRTLPIRLKDIDLQMGRREAASELMLQEEREKKQNMSFWRRALDILF